MLNRSGISVPEISISPKIKNMLSRGMAFTVLIVLGVIFLVRALFFKAEQTITQVKFSEDTLATYQDIELFNLISNEVKGKNYFLLLSSKDELLSKIQESFPFVGAIDLQLENQTEDIIENNEMITVGIQLPFELPISSYQISETIFPLKQSKADTEKGGTLGVELMYYDPVILIQLNNKRFAIWDENSYVELKDGMLLGIRNPDEEQLFLIETPMYLSGTTSLDGFFFEFSLAEFIEITTLARENFPNMERFVYLAGSRRIAIFTPDEKTLYFNFPEGGSIPEQWEMQISKYENLKAYYSRFGAVWTIDLGALGENKAIIKYF